MRTKPNRPKNYNRNTNNGKSPQDILKELGLTRGKVQALAKQSEHSALLQRVMKGGAV